MLEIKFKYMDAYSHGKWNEQECICSSISECISFYGLDDIDCSYEIISVKRLGGK